MTEPQFWKLADSERFFNIERNILKQCMFWFHLHLWNKIFHNEEYTIKK